jgi:polyisoprenoid-binding protein YceI
MTVAAMDAVVTGDYEIDERNTRIGFSARYAMITTVHGEFSQFSGVAHLDHEQPERSSVQLTVSTASLSTAQAQRDEHLRSPDFLDVETYPELLYRSTGVTVLDAGRFEVRGALTICGVTREVPAEFRLTGTAVDPAGQHLVGLTGSAAIRRGDFGLTWNTALETGGVLVGDDVDLRFDVALIRSSGRRTESSAATTGVKHLRGMRWRFRR